MIGLLLLFQPLPRAELGPGAETHLAAQLSDTAG